MKKFLTVLSMALVLCLFTTNESKAQLPANSVGIGTNFASGLSGLSLAYAFSKSFDLSLNLGYQSNSQSTDDISVSTSAMTVGLGGRIFVADTKAIDPFISLGFSYSDAGMDLVESVSQDATAMAFSGMFGGQTEIATNFFIYAATGFTYASSSADQTVGAETVTSTNSIITLGTTSVGALIYF